MIVEDVTAQRDCKLNTQASNPAMISFDESVRLQTTPARPEAPAERQRQRAARRQEVLERAGQDRQRLDRVSGHTYLLFPDRAIADEVMQEIAATPIVAGGLEWPVQMWDDDARAGIGTIAAADGRAAVGHAWSEKERAWLAGYVAGWRAVEVLDALPAEWQPKEDDQPRRR